MSFKCFAVSFLFHKLKTTICVYVVFYMYHLTIWKADHARLPYLENRLNWRIFLVNPFFETTNLAGSPFLESLIPPVYAQFWSTHPFSCNKCSLSLPLNKSESTCYYKTLLYIPMQQLSVYFRSIFSLHPPFFFCKTFSGSLSLNKSESTCLFHEFIIILMQHFFCIFSFDLLFTFIYIST